MMRSIENQFRAWLARLWVARLVPSRPFRLPEDPDVREEAVLWAHRLFRESDPESHDALARLASSVGDLPELRSRLRGERLGGRWELPSDAEGRREAARWAYRLILLREPDSEAGLDFLARAATSVEDMRNRILQSAEARAQPAFPINYAMSGDEPPQRVDVAVDEAARSRLFGKVQSVWRALGEEKPHWSVATVDSFTPDRIDQTLDEFFATGEQNVQTLVRTLERNGIDVTRIRRCMDFGCGVGRLSVALAKRFEDVVAVDVSASHLAIAREEFDKRGIANARPVLLASIDAMESLPKVDLVYSVIVLQHNPPPVMRAIFAALLGRLEAGGAAVIQVPTYLPVGYRFVLDEYEREGGKDMEMHALPQREVFALAKEAGVEVLEVLEDAWTGYGVGARSNTFVLRRPVA